MSIYGNQDERIVEKARDGLAAVKARGRETRAALHAEIASLRAEVERVNVHRRRAERARARAAEYAHTCRELRRRVRELEAELLRRRPAPLGAMTSDLNALLDALPRCNQQAGAKCTRHATYFWYGEEYGCDEHTPDARKPHAELPTAALTRRLRP